MDKRLKREREEAILVSLPMTRYSLFTSLDGNHLIFSTGRGVGLPYLMKLDHMVVKSFDIL